MLHLQKCVLIITIRCFLSCTALWVRHTCYRLTDVRARAGNASRRPWLLRLIEMDWNGLNLDCPLTKSRESFSWSLRNTHDTQTGGNVTAWTWIADYESAVATQHMWWHKLTFVALTLCIDNWWEFPLGLPRSTGATTPSVAIRSSLAALYQLPYISVCTVPQSVAYLTSSAPYPRKQCRVCKPSPLYNSACTL